MLVRVPAGLPVVTIGGLQYAADRFGVIEVPDEVGAALIAGGGGFQQVTERPPPGPPVHSA